MDICRICLNNRKRMHSLYDSIAEGISFAEMVTSIANVKVSKNDGLPFGVCQACCSRLKDIYDFKLEIERSDIELQKTFHLKRILFADIKDIKCRLDIKENIGKDAVMIHSDNITENFVKSCEKSLEYNSTVIKRVACADGNYKKTLSVKEFLESIKEDPQDENDITYDVPVDNEVESDAEVDRCDVDDLGATSDEDYTPIKYKKKRKKLTKLLEKTGVKSGSKMFIKPVYLPDIRVAPTKMPFKERKKRKQPTCKKPVKNICPYCGKMVKKLKSHMRLHTGEKKFKCEKCFKSFYTQSALTNHKMSHGNKIYKCEKCVAVFYHPGLLKVHQEVHSDVKKFSCETCGTAFKRKVHLTRHCACVHNKAHKKFSCDLCSKLFISRANLNHHMRVHTGERPYKCEICSQPYSYRADFIRHCLKKHGVFLKGRNVYVLNEETVVQERIVMRDLALRVNGILKDDKPINPFEGPHAVRAFECALKALEAKQIKV